MASFSLPGPPAVICQGEVWHYIIHEYVQKPSVPFFFFLTPLFIRTLQALNFSTTVIGLI